MSPCGSFSQDAYNAFENGIKNPTNFMVMGPSLSHHPTYSPRSVFMDEDCDECGYEGDDDDHEGWEEEEENEAEPNARMAMGQLKSMAADIMVILSEITPDDYLEPWVSAKITMSKQNLSAVADYLRYNED